MTQLLLKFFLKGPHDPDDPAFRAGGDAADALAKW